MTEQDIFFESAGIKLAGTLYSPDGIEDGPAVVVVQQAGTTTRDFPLFVQMAEVFNAIGYSVLLYDRRGHGESEGDPARPDYKTMADDAVTAKRAMRKAAASAEPEGSGGAVFPEGKLHYMQVPL